MPKTTSHTKHRSKAVKIKKSSPKKKFSFQKIHLFYSMSIIVAIVVLFLQLHSSFLHAASNPIQTENALPGTSNWTITTPSTNHGMEGYANKTSVVGGDTITFYVHTPTPVGFTADFYRLGYYQGIGARYIGTTVHVTSTQCSNLTTDLCNTKSAIPSPNPSNGGLVEANWKPSFTIGVPSNWVTGIYIVKLTAYTTGQQSYMRFVVKNPSYNSPLVFIFEDNADEAYNQYGGASLYANPANNLSAGRAYKVSFDRPFGDNLGFGKSMSWDIPMIRWIEQNGYDITYLSDTDVDANGSYLLNHKGIIVGGHAEYWSHTARANVENAVAQGISLAVFGANSFYWQIRYDLDSLGRDHRTIICFKDPQTGNVYIDPQYAIDKTRDTSQFRNAGSVNNPEQKLLGAMYSSYFFTGNAPWVIADPSSWLFAGITVSSGQKVNGIVGYEYDKVYSGVVGTPANEDIIASSQVTNYHPVTENANSVLYQAPSGAWVFDAGTVSWSWGLDNWAVPQNVSGSSPRAAVASAVIQKVTMNLLNKFISDPTPTPMLTDTPTPTLIPTATPTIDPNATPTIMPSDTPTSIPTTIPTSSIPSSSCLDAGGYRLYMTECSNRSLCGGSVCTAGCGHNPSACVGTCVDGLCQGTPGPALTTPTPTIPPSSCIEENGYRGFYEECSNGSLCGGSVCTAGCGRNPSACAGGAANCVAGKCVSPPGAPHPL